jgi:hypothetical protein
VFRVQVRPILVRVIFDGGYACNMGGHSPSSVFVATLVPENVKCLIGATIKQTAGASNENAKTCRTLRSALVLLVFDVDDQTVTLHASISRRVQYTSELHIF